MSQQKRINRLLAAYGECLRKSRSGSRWENELGEYYVVDVSANFIVEKHVDLNELEERLRG